MANSLQDRLKEIAKEYGGNRALCERSGVSERTFANWLAGSSEPKVIGISAIAQTAGVTIDWLVTGSKPKLALGPRSLNAEQMVNIAWVDQKLGDPDFDLEQRYTVFDHMPFSKLFLQDKLSCENWDQLCLFEMNGDSMEPTIGEGDVVLVDRSNNTPKDGLMAYAFNGAVFIKRVAHTATGIEIISDNKQLYPQQHISGENLKNFEFIGSVLWIGKSV